MPRPRTLANNATVQEKIRLNPELKTMWEQARDADPEYTGGTVVDYVRWKMTREAERLLFEPLPDAAVTHSGARVFEAKDPQA